MECLGAVMLKKKKKGFLSNNNVYESLNNWAIMLNKPQAQS